MVVLRAVRRRDVLGLAWRLLSARALTAPPPDDSFPRLREARVTALDPIRRRCDTFPVQVDGDYIGRLLGSGVPDASGRALEVRRRAGAQS